jgi:hypothetical protein
MDVLMWEHCGHDRFLDFAKFTTHNTIIDTSFIKTHIPNC